MKLNKLDRITYLRREFLLHKFRCKNIQNLFNSYQPKNIYQEKNDLLKLFKRYIDNLYDLILNGNHYIPSIFDQKNYEKYLDIYNYYLLNKKKIKFNDMEEKINLNILHLISDIEYFDSDLNW